LRSDEQLVALFRAGHDEAFRAIHDRYRQRLFAYARQMLPHRQDAEDVLQDVFVRAYSGLRASDRQLALRAWLYRVAHNRCVDELRRPVPSPVEVLELVQPPATDPIAEAEQRESMRRLIADIRRLPEQQRSALLLRELAGMSYADMSSALSVSVPAVKSLLVRARMALCKAAEARETACSVIREEVIRAHERRVRPNAMARRHLRDCPTCSEFRRDLRGVSRQLAALTPVGPLGAIANLLGLSGGAAGGAAGSGGVAVSAGVVTSGASHVMTLIAAAVVTAGGAVEIQHTITAPATTQPVRATSSAQATSGTGNRSQAAAASQTIQPWVQPVVEAASAAQAVTAASATTVSSPPESADSKKPARSGISPSSVVENPTTAGAPSTATPTSGTGSTATGTTGTASGTTAAGTASSATASGTTGTTSSGSQSTSGATTSGGSAPAPSGADTSKSSTSSGTPLATSASASGPTSSDTSSPSPSTTA
jgi:RNA polymerase sigma factor (sigma-70 family)